MRLRSSSEGHYPICRLTRQYLLAQVFHPGMGRCYLSGLNPFWVMAVVKSCDHGYAKQCNASKYQTRDEGHGSEESSCVQLVHIVCQLRSTFIPATTSRIQFPA